MNLLRNLLLLGLTGLSLSGCYVLQAASGQLSLLAQRKSITKVIADPATSAILRSRLEYAQAAREFASRELGLPNNKSYRSYVDLKRSEALWNVFAAPEFSVEPLQWCFPVAGCVVYRGYFKEHSAQHYAQKLRAQGFDVAVSGVPAYSTLGHFNDPIINTMMGWNDTQLAATLFHELAHQVIYVKNDSAFNEAFATVVADAGIKRWLQQQHHEDDLQKWQRRQHRGDEFSALLLQTRERLLSVYTSKQSPNDMRAQKLNAIAELKASYSKLKQQWNGYSGYDDWMSRPLNNADFIAIATYQRCVPNFEQLLQSVDGDLPKFYVAVKKIASHPGGFCNSGSMS